MASSRERTGSMARQRRGCYEVLLADALRQLPPGIDRLIVIPDGPLHHLPFDALQIRP